MTILYAIFGAVLNTGNDLVYRQSAAAKPTGEIITFYFYASAACGLMGGFAALIATGMLAGSIDELLFGVALGGLSFVAYLLFLLSLTGGSASAGVTIFRLNMIPAILFANMLLMEKIGVRRGIGIALCVVSIVLLAGSGGSSKSRVSLRRSFISVGACLLGGAATFFNKVAMTEGYQPFRLLFWRFVTVTAICGIYLSVGSMWRPSKEHLKYAPLSGFFMCASLYFILEALQGGDLSVVMPITHLSFVFVALFSWIFLHEPVTPRKTVGSVLAVAVVILIT